MDKYLCLITFGQHVSVFKSPSCAQIQTIIPILSLTHTHTTATEVRVHYFAVEKVVAREMIPEEYLKSPPWCWHGPVPPRCPLQFPVNSRGPLKGHKGGFSRPAPASRKRPLSWHFALAQVIHGKSSSRPCSGTLLIFHFFIKVRHYEDFFPLLSIAHCANLEAVCSLVFGKAQQRVAAALAFSVNTSTDFDISSWLQPHMTFQLSSNIGGLWPPWRYSDGPFPLWLFHLSSYLGHLQMRGRYRTCECFD